MLRRIFLRRALGVLAAVYAPSLVPTKPLVEPLSDGFAEWTRAVQQASLDDPPIHFGEALCGPDGGYLIPPEIEKSLATWERAGFPPLRANLRGPGVTATWTEAR